MYRSGCVGATRFAGGRRPGTGGPLRGAQQFLQFEVDKKFRQAEGLVAEASKDFFYNGSKPSINSFRIDSVSFPDDKTALVKIHGAYLIVIPGAPAAEHRVGVYSDLETGEWRMDVFLSIPMPCGRTPFGKAA